MYRSMKALTALALVLVVLFSVATCALADKSTDVLNLVNQQRKAAGLKKLTLDANLNRVAALRAAEIVERWSHTRPDGSEWKTAFAEEGVSASYRGENLAKGQYSAKLVVKQWMASSGHKANILNKKFTKMGVASVVIDGYTYWVQVFANEVKTTGKTNPGKTSGASSQSGSTGSGSKPTNDPNGVMSKLSPSSDLQAAMNGPAATTTSGQNPGL